MRSASSYAMSLTSASYTFVSLQTDMTATFLHDSVRRFAKDVDLFMKEQDLSLNIVDKASGY
jgi:hypothetical protein